MRKRKVLIGLIAAGALAIGAVVGVAAQAPGDGGSGGGNFIAKLAANLGIGEDKLKSAIDLTHTQLIDEAVAAGKLTQAQAGSDEATHGGGQGLRQRLPQCRTARGPKAPVWAWTYTVRSRACWACSPRS